LPLSRHAAVLRRAGASTVSDALDALGLPGAVEGIGSVGAGRPIAGRVVTTRLGPEEQPKGAHLGTRAIDAAAPGDVVVMATGGFTGAGSWGGLLTLAAVTKGIAGVVSDGAARDVDESRAHGFPVYARATVVKSARGRLYEQAFNEPVEVDGVAVSPGDFVVADATGVAFVAAAHVEAVVAKAGDLLARERQIAAALAGGAAARDALGGNYERMLEDA
jgi:4-hydroxy-4-methyl-2-oxoglutarate aldolase